MPATPEIVSTPAISITPATLQTPTATTLSATPPSSPDSSAANTHIPNSNICISCNSSQHNIDTDSGKSSCSPALLDCSYDSGISGVLGLGLAAELDNERHERMQQLRFILLALERRRDVFHELRARLSKITDRKTKKQIDEETFCNVCCQEIEAQNAKSCVTCCLCNKRICRNGKCSNWLPKSAQWECQLCHSSKESLAQTSSWVAEQMSFTQQKYVYPMRARSEIYIPISDFHDNASSIHFESASQLGVNMNTITAEQKLKIREYVEEVVANMLGGSLDQIRVGQISKSENYLPSIANGRHNTTAAHAANNNNNQLEFSAMSQTRLRQLIESIIAETLRMPALTGGTVSELALNRHAQSNGSATLPLVNGNVRRHRTEHYFEPKIYQDLLATAVLNKIVDNQGNVRQLSESTPDLSARNIDPNYNVENQSTTSGSSVEPRSDCSYTDTEQPPQIGKVEQLSPFDSERNRYVDDADNLISAGRESALSDYIASHMVPLPDLSTNVTESEEDDRVSVTSSAPGEGTWEDNWLFKKKRPSLSASIATGSVGMLVPAPKEDVRAQIGDKTTDEISDLSEMGSDTDDSLDMLRGNLDPLNDRLLSKQLIGGQNTKIVLDELIERASLVSNTALAADEPQFTETKNEHLVETATRTKAINTDVDKLQVEELDMGLLSPPAHFKDTNSKLATTAQNGSSGSVAEREYKKWDNAVDMPNNPYAPEELKKRISGSQERFMDVPSISPTSEQIAIIKANTEVDAKAAEEEVTRENYKRYSRDYYINEDSQNSSRRQTDNSISPNISDDPSTDIAINEVNAHGNNTSSPNSKKHSDCHWTLSTPVRRSSSLKFINNRSSPKSHYNFTATTTPRTCHQQTHQLLPPRPFTSASHYNRTGLTGNDDDDDDDKDYDVCSQRSWRSASAAGGHFVSALPKRHTLSSLSVHSSVSGVSMSSSASKKRALPSASVLSQFEKQLLHKDLKRNSFRATSATTKDFVMNPLFERSQICGDNGRPKLSLKPDTDEQVDSGVDSCLNGFSETDAKTSNNSLLF